MRPKKQSTYVVGATLSLAVLAVTACGVVDNQRTGEPTPCQAEPFLAFVADGVVLPAYDAFLSSAEQLLVATRDYEEALATQEDATAALATAQHAWRQAMLDWQRLEVLQMGDDAALLRDEIYSWPLGRMKCSVDLLLGAENFAERMDSSRFWADPQNLPDIYGLGTLEYLLFHQQSSNQCPSMYGINQLAEGQTPWQLLAADGQLPSRRAAYAVLVAHGLLSKSTEVAGQWRDDAVGKAAKLRRAGQVGTGYGVAWDGVNAITDALFYLEKPLKDSKLGLAAGLVPCKASHCQQDVESPWAKHSTENVIANLQAFAAVWAEDSQLGLAACLRQNANAEALPMAERMTAALDAALQNFEGMTEPLHDVVLRIREQGCDDAQDDKFCQGYQALQRLMRDFKGEFATIMKIKLPQEAQGDND